MGPPKLPTQIALPLSVTLAQSMAELIMSPSFRSLHVSQSEATLRGSIETDHHQDLIFMGLVPTAFTK
jgi:hypothetical protein